MIKAPTRRKRAAAPGSSPAAITGKVRLGKRTKHLVRRVGQGDIAVVGHRDLDRVSGEELVRCQVRAVINCQEFSSGAYPNVGPLLLAEAGITQIECLDADLFELLNDGDAVEIADGELRRNGKRIAAVQVLAPEAVVERNQQLQVEVGAALEAFARNTVEHMIEERELLSGRIDLPNFDTDIRDRHVLIVVRGVGHQRDLRALGPYIRDVKPVIIAVDGGAEAVREEGLTPDMIVGDMDSASEETLRAGAELIVHAYPDGRAPGKELLERLGVEHKVLPAPGTSQDIAMLIAAEKGAQLIVSVGSQFNLMEFLDKSRRGMSSTFLTRLRLGELLVDAKGVSRLYRPRPGLAPVGLLAAAGLVTFLLVVAITPGLTEFSELLWLKLRLLLGLA